MIDKKIPYWINTKFISDKRGSLYKFINHKVIKEIKFKLIEAQISEYKKNVFRGFYAQLGRSSEMKLIQLLEGKAFWFTINLKKNKYYGKVDIFSLKKNKLLFVPKGYAHGSYSLDNSKVLVLANNIYNKKDYLGLIKFNLLKKKFNCNLYPLGGIKISNINRLKNINTEAFAILSEVKKKPAIISRLF